MLLERSQEFPNQMAQVKWTLVVRANACQVCRSEALALMEAQAGPGLIAVLVVSVVLEQL